VAACAETLETLGDKPRIGISWRSTSTLTSGQKSVPLDRWGPILSERDAVFVNLQYGDTDDEVVQATADFECDIFTDPEIDRFNDLEGLAALVDGLDLVISVSNVTAHFAGALGKPCWLMLQSSPIWYWGHEDRRVPFYSTLRAFRQSRFGDWDSVVGAVARDLDETLG
jgi:ADP-heptose:LPS heptosyltransferase